jgi:hypothetical protein
VPDITPRPTPIIARRPTRKLNTVLWKKSCSNGNIPVVLYCRKWDSFWPIRSPTNASGQAGAADLVSLAPPANECGDAVPSSAICRRYQDLQWRIPRAKGSNFNVSVCSPLISPRLADRILQFFQFNEYYAVGVCLKAHFTFALAAIESVRWLIVHRS